MLLLSTDPSNQCKPHLCNTLIQNSDFIKGFDKKDNEFLSRIRKHRPQELLSVGAADNIRVLDYYGERITSVKEYRSWLRVQRDFKKTGRLPHRLGG